MRRDDRHPTRSPKQPPFPVGARLRYIGQDRLRLGRDGIRSHDPSNPDHWVTVLETGIIVTIDGVSFGRQGTGRVVETDEDGYGLLDATRDGYSVYHIPETRFGRCIDPDDARDWEIVS